MDPDEIYVHSQALLLKIHVITGWVIPAKDLMIVLLDQFNKKLKESYDIVNPDEIEYAFRAYGTTVKDWGKQMNLSLIDEVMIPYLNARNEVSKIEEQVKSQPKQIEENKQLTDEEKDAWFEEICGLISSGKLPMLFIPIEIYIHLENKGELVLSKEEKHEYMDKAINYRHAKLSEGAVHHDRDAIKALKEFNEMKEKGFGGQELNKLKDLARKIAVWEYIQTISL